EEAQRLADTVLIMSHGQGVARGKPSDLVVEHAGREVLEVYGPPTRLAEVESEAGAAGLKTRRTGTSVSVLGLDGRNGFGGFVSRIGGFTYVQFVGTGTVATAVLFSSAFAAMFGTFVKYQFQRTYDAILAAPVDTEELVTAESLWIAARAGVYGCVPMIVAIFFGLDPTWAMLTVPFIGWLTGLGWAHFGIMVAGFAKAIENFNYIVSAVLTPLFLLAGTFFPLTGLPEWV